MTFNELLEATKDISCFMDGDEWVMQEVNCKS